MSNLYQVLGVDAHASAEEIRQAYKRLVLIHHPDKGGAAASFHIIHLAVETLSSPLRRKSYDEHVALYHHRVQRVAARIRRTGASSQRRATSRIAASSRRPASRLEPSSIMEPLGAGVPPKKRDPGGQRPRALLLRSLRRLHDILAVQPTDLRQETIGRLSHLLKEELTAFILHKKARGGQASSAVRSVGAGPSDTKADAAAGQSRLWLCGGIGRAGS